MIYCDYSGNQLVSVFVAIVVLAIIAIIPSSSRVSNSKIAKSQSNESIFYDVPLYNQGDLSLCWAYCEVMVDSYRNSESLKSKEANNKAIQIAKKYHNSTSKEEWNKGGWPTNLGERVAINSISDLYDVLLKNGPVYGLYNSDSSSHLIVITGVDVDNDLVFTNNPWGVKGKQSFEAFQSGVAHRWWQSNQELVFDAVYLIQ